MSTVQQVALKYEVKEAQDSVSSDNWIVEAIAHDNDGEVYMARFTGPEAESRALEYAHWMNGRAA